MLSGYLKISLVIIVGLLALFSCRNKCRDIECTQSLITFQIKNYSPEEVQDSLLRVDYLNQSLSPFISKGNGQFSVEIIGLGEMSIFYNDTLKAISTFKLKSVEGECCNFLVPTELKIDGELKCTNYCSRDSVYDVEL